MLFEYTFFLKNFDKELFNDKVAQNNAFIIPIDEHIFGGKRQLFQTLINSSNQFCFYLPSDLTNYSTKFIKEEIIQNIVRLIFLPNYMRMGEKHIFFSEAVKDHNKNFNSILNKFFDELKKQGIKDVINETLQFGPSFEGPSDENCISLVHYDLNYYLSSEVKGECFETFIRKFVVPEKFYKKWIVPIENFDAFHRKIKLIEKFEKWMRLTSPFDVRLIEMYRLANNNNTKLELENKLLRFKLDNSLYSLKLMREESFGFIEEVAILRREIDRLVQQITNPTSGDTNNEELMKLQNQIDKEHDRADSILQWYKREYEVLPGWYKRFGHVIKAFKGKRTFKSLFK